MRYDEFDNTIHFVFSGYQDLHRYEGLHTISINLTDKMGKWSNYLANVTLHGPPPKEYKQSWTYLEPNLTAYVQEITVFGTTTIKFSKQMDFKDVKLTDINSTVLDIYLEPYDNWHENYEDFNITKFNFTWFAVDYYNDILVIKISFFEPHYISSREVRDMLYIHFKTTGQGLVLYNVLQNP